MKLYRVQALSELGNMVAKTRFVTSMTEAKRLKTKFRKGDNRAEITTVYVPDRLVASEWIELLEYDSPGNQEDGRTPVDFMIMEEPQ